MTITHEHRVTLHAWVSTPTGDRARVRQDVEPRIARALEEVDGLHVNAQTVVVERPTPPIDDLQMDDLADALRQAESSLRRLSVLFDAERASHGVAVPDHADTAFGRAQDEIEAVHHQFRQMHSAPSYGLPSLAGEQLLHRHVEKLCAKAPTLTDRQLRHAVAQAIESMVASGHPMADDTAVREAVWERVAAARHPARL